MRGKHGNHPKSSGHPRWKAGSTVASNGYVKVRVGKEHPLADPNGYTYEHLLVWTAAGNPRPDKTQVIHHRNGNKTDNRIENLEVLDRRIHNHQHLTEQPRRCETSGRLLPKAQPA